MRKVFRKELFEMFRDRRVMFGAFVMPAVTILMMFSLINTIEKSVKKQRSDVITFVSGGEDSSLAKNLKANQIKTVPSLAAGRKALERGETKLVVQVDPNFDEVLQSGQAKITALYDSTETLSEVLLKVFRDQIDKAYAPLVDAKLSGAGLSRKDLTPVIVVEEDVAKDAAKQGSALAQILPYIILLWAFYGGMSSVSDMVAGEKERGTLETLLISPVKRTEIALGKFGALFAICLASSACAFLGVMIARMMFKGSSMAAGGASLPVGTVLCMVLAMLPMVAMFTGILLAVSSWAKNMREAQTYLAVVSFVVLIPAMMSNMLGFIDIGRSNLVGFIPVLSTGVVLRSGLMGEAKWSVAGISALTSLVIASILLWWVVRMFNNERILARV